jgi:hypothetical protein
MSERGAAAHRFERGFIEREMADMLDPEFVAETLRVDALSTVAAGVGREQSDSAGLDARAGRGVRTQVPVPER